MMKQFGLKMMLGAALLSAGLAGTACRKSPSAGEGSGSGAVAETGPAFDAADQFALKGAPLKGAENALVPSSSTRTSSAPSAAGSTRP